MTDSELKKAISYCSGADKWHTEDYPDLGLPPVMMADGPNGLRKQEGKMDNLGIGESKPATCYPTASIAACSFDTELMEAYGDSLGREAGSESVSMVLGPGLNIKRNPLCGRNFEYLSEDPYLAGKMGAAFVHGMQRTGIGSCIKHFACNSQELYRMASDSRLDERTLREIYLTAFEIAVKEAQPRAVMCSYNRLNGIYAASNRRLLTEILRDEWGYEGMVVTDWGALEDRSESFRAGCDLAMPGGNDYGEKEAFADVKAGRLSEEDVLRCRDRVAAFAAAGVKGLENRFHVSRDECHETAKRIAAESAVLLRNREDMLPLRTLDGVLFVGLFAEQIRYQGAGSSRINPSRLDQIRELLPEVPYARGCLADGSTTEELLREAVEKAKAAEKVVIFAGLPGIYESEGYDRDDMKMPEGHVKLIERVSGANRNTAVVLFGGAPMETPWADDVKAILYMGLPGQAGAAACIDLLTGEANPSGKLAESWPERYEDTVTAPFYGKEKDARYREGIYVGYRYYDKSGVRPRFPFGHGLSCTRFRPVSIRVSEDHRTVCVDVANEGTVPGKESVLVYVHGPAEGRYLPVRELKAFGKTEIAPGETATLTFALDERAYQIWDGGWKTLRGQYYIEAAGSGGRTIESEPFLLEGVELSGETAQWYTRPSGAPSDEDWSSIYRETASETPLVPFTPNSVFGDLRRGSALARLAIRFFERKIAKDYGKDTPEYKGTLRMAEESPLRSVQMNGGLKKHFAQALADLGNGKYLQMIRHMLS